MRAALPLLIEHGSALTTRQVSQAAGIAEGTVFRAFADKEELVRTCVTEAFRTDELRTRIAETAAEPDLADRMTAAGVLVDEHMTRIGELMQTLATSGYDVRKHSGGPPDRPPQFVEDIIGATVPLLAGEQLRRPEQEIARVFFGLLTSLRFERITGDRREHVRRRVDLLLRGALPD